MSSSANPRKATIVTGASEGIGAELARVFAAKGIRSCSWRRGDYLERLSGEITATGVPKASSSPWTCASPEPPTRWKALCARPISPWKYW